MCLGRLKATSSCESSTMCPSRLLFALRTAASHACLNISLYACECNSGAHPDSVRSESIQTVFPRVSHLSLPFLVWCCRDCLEWLVACRWACPRRHWLVQSSHHWSVETSCGSDVIDDSVHAGESVCACVPLRSLPRVFSLLLTWCLTRRRFDLPVLRLVLMHHIQLSFWLVLLRAPL